MKSIDLKKELSEANTSQIRKEILDKILGISGKVLIDRADNISRLVVEAIEQEASLDRLRDIVKEAVEQDSGANQA